MPIVASFGAMTVRGLGLFSATTGPSYWIGRLLGSSSVGSRAVAIDPAGSVYLCGGSVIGGTVEIQLAKYSSSGTLAWQRNLGTAGADESGSGVAVDSSGNAYITGAAGGVFQIAKYTTDGTLSWQRSLSGETGSGLDATVDSSGNVYVSGYSSSGGVGYLQLAKYDTSGTLAWKQRLNGGSDAASNGVAVDSSGNVFVCGYTLPGPNYEFQIAKYSSAGVLSWQRSLGASGIEDFGQAVALDASGDVYILGSSNAGGSYNLLLAKYNSAGAFQWQRKLGDAGIEFGNSVAVDGSTPANVYVCGQTNTSGTNDFLIAKYSAAGVIAWQRRLGSTASDAAFGIKVDSSDNIYVCGVTDNADFLFAKLPGDGSLTGTYTVGGNSYTYAATTLTEDFASLTDAQSFLASSTSTLTDGATSLTSATSTLTSYVTTI
jgi:uncharacterized delta-60 repeat protein